MPQSKQQPAKTLVLTCFKQVKRPTILGCFFLLLVNILDNILPLVQKLGIDIVAADNLDWSLQSCAILYLAIIFTQALARYSYRKYLGQANTGVAAYLRKNFCSKLFHAPQAYINQRNAGELLTRANSDVDTLSSNFELGIIHFFDALIYIILIPSILLFFSPSLTLICLLPFTLLPVLLRIFEKPLTKKFKALQTVQDSLASLSQQTATSQRLIKTLTAEETFYQRYSKLAKELLTQNTALAKTEFALGPLLESCVIVSSLILICLGGLQVLDGSMTLGTLVAFQRYLQRLQWPVQAIAVSFNNYQKSLSSAERLLDLLNANSETSGSMTLKDTQYIDRLEPILEVKAINFTYPNSSQPTLKNISFKLLKGQKLALLGDNAAGKSTLLGLLIRIYAVESGEIKICGQNIIDWDLKALRDTATFISQENLILSDTIEENLAFGLIDWRKNNANLRQAATQAALDSHISTLKNGYQTLLGERGLTFSGGQRQRLCLARGLAKHSKILLLDDCFSAVDSQTEAQIFSNIWNQEHSIIITTHRLSSLQKVDQIIVLANGEIIQQGTHQELIKQRNSWYHKFYQRQSLQEEFEAYAKRQHNS